MSGAEVVHKTADDGTAYPLCGPTTGFWAEGAWSRVTCAACLALQPRVRVFAPVKMRFPDQHGNTVAREGADRCACGCKYWERDRCIDCGGAPPGLN